MRPLICGFILFVCLVVVASLSICIGPVDFTSTQILEALKGEGGAEALYIIRHIRGPRTVLAILVGGGLALSGAVFQALLRNPLADPYILGISSGAATGAVLVLSLGLAVAQPWILPAAAFAGSLIAIFDSASSRIYPQPKTGYACSPSSWGRDWCILFCLYLADTDTLKYPQH